MSRIGKNPVQIPDGVSVELAGTTIKAKGKLGELSETLIDEVILSKVDDTIVVKPANDTKRSVAMWGMARSKIQNIVDGVSEGFTKALDITGVGYRAAMQGNALVLQLGFSHEVKYPVPVGIKISCPEQTQIVIEGADKQKVGQVAAEIRAYRPPEPYKGKGVRYAGEYILRKEGKKK
ncbi:MAG: 50S ribosomal protein L6 [Rhodospirillaceae bacterium]